MNELDKIYLDIENLKRKFNTLIEEENCIMTSLEVVTASQKLDEVIVRYSKLEIKAK